MPVTDAHSSLMTAMPKGKKEILESRHQPSSHLLDSLLLPRFLWLKAFGGQDRSLLRDGFQGVEKQSSYCIMAK